MVANDPGTDPATEDPFAGIDLGGTTTDLIGVPRGYDPTKNAYSGPNPYQPGTKAYYQYSKRNPMGAIPVNQFNRQPNAPLYKNGDEWDPVKAPEGISFLQSQL